MPPAPISAPTTAPGSRSAAVDFAVVAAAWAVAVVAAAAFPVDDARLTRAALFIHVMAMAVGFGAVIMIDVYGLLWLLGQRTLAEVVDLARTGHVVIAVGIGGLLSSGVALRPELDTPLARLKMVLVFVVMWNGAAAQRALHRMRQSLPAETRGAGIPWAGFQRMLAAALVSQATWWGAIAIGFITSTNRHS